MNASRSAVVIGALLVIGPMSSAFGVAQAGGVANPSLFAPSDVTNARMLAREISGGRDLVSAYVWSRLPAALQTALTNWTAPLAVVAASDVDALNFVVQGESIYDVQLFADLAIAPELLALAGSNPQGTALLEVNRRLLEAAYPFELRQSAPLPPAGPSVTTDRTDYAPGTTAWIRGAGFLAGETVSLQVLHADGTPDTGEEHEPWSVVAGATGGFQSSWHVCEDDCLGATLELTASGHTSGRMATALFSDAAGALTYQQLKSFGSPSVGGNPFGTLIQIGGQLYGTAASGGSFGYGTVFRMNTDGSNFTVLLNFNNSTSGGFPAAGLLHGTDGALYGTTTQGGASDVGTLYKLNTDGSGFDVLASLDDTTGNSPRAALIQGTDGALYGTTPLGGSEFGGTIFKVNTDGSGFTVLVNLDDPTTGSMSFAALLQASDGKLYGTTSSGGGNGGGTVFRLNLDGSGFTVLLDLDPGTTGSAPSAALMQASNGFLYGTASAGGSNGAGTIYRLNLDGTGVGVLRNFENTTTGSSPFAALMQGTDGGLYGTAFQGGSFGGGTVYELNLDGSVFAVLKSFDDATTGSALYAGLMQGSDGSLYGAAVLGGSETYGTLFELETDGSGFTVLKNLFNTPDSSQDGSTPAAALLQGTNGLFYGTAHDGGSFGAGVVYRIGADGSGFVVLRSFEDVVDGGFPAAPLVQGSDGALYGTTSVGGAFGFGTLFKLNPDGSGFTVLHDFDNAGTGADPFSALTLGSDGKLYGTTLTGGSTPLGFGTAFRLNTDGTGFTVLARFDDVTTGSVVFAGLTEGSDGVLYGAASEGGSFGGGTVFRMNRDGTDFTVLRNLDDATTGGHPHAALVQATNGVLYGAASTGGSDGFGTVFKLNPDGSGFTVLHDFDAVTNGSTPLATLMQADDGMLYSTALQGGSGGAGVVYRLATDGSSFTVLQAFDNSTIGGFPFGSVIQGTDGSFYSTTSSGGVAGVGTVFRLVFSTAPIANAGPDFSVNEGQLVTLDGTASSAPGGGSLAYSWVQLPGGTPVTLADANTATPTFTSPVVAFGGETLSFQLTVTANSQSASDTVSVTIVNVNHVPVADAGSAQSVAGGSPVTLHGEGSFDVDNDPLTFQWIQVGGSPTVTLTGADSANPQFTAPVVGPGGASLVFLLTVDDGFPPDAPAPGYDFSSVSDLVTITVTHVNNPPVAAAGSDQTVDENTGVTLNGTGSGDPDGDPLTFSWIQTGGPAVTLAGALSATPFFTAPFVSTGGADLTFELTVNDGHGGTATDSVLVHVMNVNDPPNVGGARPTTAVLPVPSHGIFVVGITGVADSNDDTTITIDAVTQDEPTSGLGDGDTGIDAFINPDGTVLLRAERAGGGDGRVYHIYFTATSSSGSSSGVVIVGVPHDKKHAVVDSGVEYVSTQQ